MARLRVRSNRKAVSVPLSLKPKHVVMLRELEVVLKKNRSKIVQRFIEDAYADIIEQEVIKKSNSVEEFTGVDQRLELEFPDDK